MRSSTSRTTSEPKVENVVSVPQKPVPTRATTQAGAADDPSTSPEDGAPGDVDGQRPDGGVRPRRATATRSTSSRSGRPGQRPDRHEQRRHVCALAGPQLGVHGVARPTSARPASRPTTTAATPPVTEAST